VGATFVPLRPALELEERVAALEAANAGLEAAVDRQTAMILLLTVRVGEAEKRIGTESTAPLEGDLICVKDAAYRTQYSQSAVHKWVKQGRVVWKKIGGRVLIEARSLPPSAKK
jgi:hypothetical protein